MGKSECTADAGQHGRQAVRRGRRWRLASVSLLLIAPLFAVALPQTTAVAAPRPAAVSVPATHWIYAGVNVKAGDLLRITAAGSWTDGATTSGPTGVAKRWPDNFFNFADLGACNNCAKTSTSQWGALIGYIGASPPVPGSYTSGAVRPQALKVFYVGGNYEASALDSGKLWLYKNADAYSGHTSDNHGHVVAKITVLPPESASKVAARARAAARSVNALTSLQEAANFCGRSVLEKFSHKVMQGALNTLVPGGGTAVFEGATIIGDSVKLDYSLSNGQLGNATFDIGRLVFAALGHVPEFKLFGLVGEPAIDCTEAGFWFTGQLGGQLGQLLRQKLWPPATAAAGIEGTWTLKRSVLTCVNFPEGCHTSAINIRFSNCAKKKCVMSRTDGVWKSSHVIRLQGRTWVAHFKDIAIACHSQNNPARVAIRLSVTTSYTQNGIKVAKTLGGTYSVTATTNPPNCQSNGRTLQNLHGSRS
jgi:hypothetical protein